MTGTRRHATEAEQQLVVELVLKRKLTIKAAGEQAGMSAYTAGQIVRKARGIAQGSASSPFPKTKRRLNGNAWQVDAACRDHDPELWFPVGRGQGTTGANGSNVARDAYELQVAQAQDVCAGCPVLEQCGRDHAREPWGVWAGSRPHEERSGKAGVRTFGQPAPAAAPEAEKVSS